jgi:hypothetical protein
MLSMLSMLFLLCACEEKPRFEIGYEDSVPPAPPTYIGHTPLNGGARIKFRIPADEDLLSIDASYVNAQGKRVWFSASYFHDTINVYGFSNTDEQMVELYSVDRAGNKSEVVPIYINNALEPAYLQIANSLILKPSFESLFMEWENVLLQNVNVYADLSYTQNGTPVEHKLIYTSNVLNERWVIRDLTLTEQEPMNVKIRVEDSYGNITDYIDKGQITLLEDEKIPKDKWTLPEVGTYMGDEPMGFLSGNEGRAIYAIDDIIDDGKNMNYVHTEHRGRTGNTVDLNSPWNIFIDLGDKYELSRIITHQRYSGGSGLRGTYYMDENVGTYKMYIWNDERERWDSVSRHTIPYVEGLSDIEYLRMGKAGDMAYLYPDEPHFTPPTRWFRYESLLPFGKTDVSSWMNLDHCLSEITLYGRKAK